MLKVQIHPKLCPCSESSVNQKSQNGGASKIPDTLAV